MLLDLVAGLKSSGWQPKGFSFTMGFTSPHLHSFMTSIEDSRKPLAPFFCGGRGFPSWTHFDGATSENFSGGSLPLCLSNL